MEKKIATKILLALLGFVCLSCRSQHCEIQPQVALAPTQALFDCTPTAFDPLNEEEAKQDWGKELLIGNTFAKEFDLYRAITAYKRALVLIHSDCSNRRLQLQYNIIRSYYLGRKHQEVIETFEASDLIHVSGDFPAIGDLLIMLQESYRKIDQDAKADKVLCIIEKSHPEKGKQLRLDQALEAADFCELENFAQDPCYQGNLSAFLLEYDLNKKSSSKAETLNALLPGAGYWYVGQKKAAITSFVINALFIAAAYEFFNHGYTAAGLITTSLEMGWYIGGINGAGLAAKEHNEWLYQTLARDYMCKNRIFPVLMLQTNF